MPNRIGKDEGVSVEFSQAELLRFERDIKGFINQFGEKKAENILRSAVRRIPLREAKGILAQEAQNGTGALEDKGLIVAKEQGSDTISLLMGGGRAKKNTHGWLAHWVELGTSGVVRDGGKRYKSGQRYRAATQGIHFLERSAEKTKGEMFKSLNGSIKRAFSKLKK